MKFGDKFGESLDGRQLGNPLTSCRSLSGPPGPKSKKSLKRVSPGVPESLDKVSKKSKKSGKSLKSLEKVSLKCPGTFLETFWDPGAGGWTGKSPHHSHKIDDQHRECKTGGGAYFAFFLNSDNSHTTPPKIPLDEEGLLWGWCVVGGPLGGSGRLFSDSFWVSAPGPERLLQLVRGFPRSRTEKAPKENLHKEFRRDPGRGVKEGAWAPKFFM